MADPLKDQNSNCPSELQLSQLLSGELGGHDETEIDTHVGQCLNCQTLLERITDSEQGRYWKQLLESGQSYYSEGTEHKTAKVGSARVAEPQLVAAMRERGFELIRMIGRGGVGVVYLAKQARPSRDVAIKMLIDHQADSDEVARFVREANSMAEISHKNVVQIYQVDQCLGRPFQVQEFVDGPTLSQFLGNSPQDPQQVARCMLKIARGAAAAHRRGVLHRDLKPGNILLLPLTENTGTQTLSEFTPKIADFGLARPLVPDTEYNLLTRTNQLLGTPQFMSPEQVVGDQKAIDHRSDIYSMGVILYQMLTGKLPFYGSGQYQLLKKIESGMPKSLRRLQPDIPKDLEAICLMCLEKEPKDRYATAEDFAEDLDQYLHGQSTRARKISVFHRTAKWIVRNKRHVSYALTAVTAALLPVVILWSWLNGRNEDFQEYQSSLARAQQLFASAESAELTDVEAWTAARAEASLAASFELNYPEWAPDKKGETLLSEADSNLRDRTFFRQLETLWENEFLVVDRLPKSDLVTNFREMIDNVGWSLEQSPTEAAAVLQSKSTPVAQQLKTALFHFADALADTREGDWCIDTFSKFSDEEWRLAILQKNAFGSFNSLLSSPDLSIGEDGLALVAGAMFRRTTEMKLLEEYLQSCIDSYPESFWLSMFLAKNQLLQGNLDRAKISVQNVIAKHDNKAARYFLSKILHDQKRYDEEEFHLLRALDFDSDFDIARAGLARCYHLQQRFVEAITCYQQSLEKLPHVPGIADELLQCYVDADMSEEAKKFAEELTRNSRETHAACRARAKAHLYLGQLDLAIKQFEKAIEHDPLRLPCYYDLAKIHVDRKDYESAEPLLRRFFEMMPMSYEAGRMLIDVLDKQHRWNAAKQVAEVRVAHLSKLPSTWEDLGKIQVKLKDDEGAEQSFRESIALDPHRVTALVELAKIQHRARKFELAESNLRAAVRIRPNSEVANGALIDFLLGLRRNQESIEFARSLAESRPNSLFAQWKYMKALQAVGEIETALVVFKDGRKIDGPNPRFFTDAKLESLKKIQAVIRQYDELESVATADLTPLQAEQFANFVLAPRGRYRLAAELGMRGLTERSHHDDSPFFLAVYQVAVNSLLASQMQDTSETDQLKLREQAVQMLETFVNEFRLFARQQPGRVLDGMEAWRLLPDNVGLFALRDEAALLNVPKSQADRCRRLWQQFDQILREVDR